MYSSESAPYMYLYAEMSHFVPQSSRNYANCEKAKCESSPN